MANPFIKKAHIESEFSADMVRELHRCATDPVYCIKHYFWIQHPTKGRVKFILFDYQEQMIRDLHEKRDVVILASRQMGKTQTVSMYLLWYSMFATKDDPKFILIASKNNGHAMEIMNRIRYTYEELEHWLKPGVNYYNKHEIEFDNGSSMKSEATTPNTGRGLAISKLFIDELAFVNPRIQEEMWASLAPTLSTGGGFILSSTPNGDSELFAQLWRGANSGTNPFFPIRVDWHQHPDRDESYVEDMRSKLGELKLKQEVFNEFVSSDALLISSLALQQIKPLEPLFENNGYKFWKKINPQCAYYVGCDIATGIGSDFSTIEVIEFPSLEQVAEFRANGININTFYMKLRWLLRYLSDPLNSEVIEEPEGAEDIRKNDRLLGSVLTYHQQVIKRERPKPDVFWSFENNGLGHAFVALLQNDENFPEGAELITAPGQVMGVNTSSKTKLMAGLELKRSAEKTVGGLTLYSRDLIFEMNNLVSNNKGTFHAKAGATDDCVSALLVVMQIFKYTADHDEKLYNVVYDYSEGNDNGFGEEVDYEPPSMLF